LIQTRGFFVFTVQSSVVSIKLQRSRSAYDISIGQGSIGDVGAWAAKCLGRKGGKVLIVSNRKVFGLYGNAASRSLGSAGFAVFTHLIGDGEQYKNLKTLESTLKKLSELGFTRDDAVVALGGGVVGDLAGFAASVYLRGIAFLQVPTTFLAMIDSSVGGKTGVNSSFGKNLIGSFYQPKGVLIDTNMLVTLPRRELTAGFCEAVKQAAISSLRLLRQTGSVLDQAGRKRSFEDPKFHEDLAALVAANVKFKARIVQNDELEAADNITPTSRKILNFGHTLAHALEKVTKYKYLKHGEAVGHGVRFAAELSKNLELLASNEVDLLNDVVRRAGVLPAISHIDPSEVIEAFRYDKKKVGGSVNWILLRGIGRPVIVQSSIIPTSTIRSTVRSFLRS
jgi:3-dehydroquinate synthase